jgi:hypothetical protein
MTQNQKLCRDSVKQMQRCGLLLEEVKSFGVGHHHKPPKIVIFRTNYYEVQTFAEQIKVSYVLSTMANQGRVIRRASILSYNEFRQDHLLPNVPVIIGPKLIEEWPCIAKWRLSTDASENQAKLNTRTESLSESHTPRCSRPNLKHLVGHYGDMKVPTDEDGCRSERKLEDVIHIWTSNGELDIEDVSSIHSEDGRIYAKDWHLALELSKTEIEPKLSFYKTPELFRDDWMNRYYLQETNDDFRFVVSMSLLLDKFFTERLPSTLVLQELLLSCIEMYVRLLCNHPHDIEVNDLMTL